MQTRGLRWQQVLPLALVGIGTIAGCGIPRDPDGTLDRVEGGVLRVGLHPDPPWAAVGGEGPSGVEVALVNAFASELGAEIEWVEGTEADLFGAIKAGELDVVIGGFTSTSPWKANAAFTTPYLTTELVIGLPRGDTVLSLDGLEVAVEAGTEAVALVDGTDAIAVPVPDVRPDAGPAAVEAWELEDLGLRPSGTSLKSEAHVLATPLGENAFLVRLERFLLADKQRAVRLLDAVGP